MSTLSVPLYGVAQLQSYPHDPGYTVTGVTVNGVSVSFTDQGSSVTINGVIIGGGENIVITEIPNNAAILTVTGPLGPPGPPGPSGPNGPTGATGPAADTTALNAAVSQASGYATSAGLAAATVQTTPAFTTTTLALLNTYLTPGDGSLGRVTSDGTNTGDYAKVGASGTGSWTRKPVSIESTPSTLRGQVKHSWQTGEDVYRENRDGTVDIVPSRTTATAVMRKALSTVSFPGQVLLGQFSTDKKFVEFLAYPPGEGAPGWFRQKVYSAFAQQVTQDPVELHVTFGDSRSDDHSEGQGPSAWTSAAFTGGGANARPNGYLIGDQVTYNSVSYTSLQNNNLGNVPSSSPTFWQPFAGPFWDALYAAGTGLGGNALNTPPSPYRLFMLNTPHSPGHTDDHDNSDWPVLGAGLKAIPLQSGYNAGTSTQSYGQDTITPHLARIDKDDVLRNRPRVTRFGMAMGETGYRIAEISKGGYSTRPGNDPTLQPYARLMDAITRTMAYVLAPLPNGLGRSAFTVPWVHLRGPTANDHTDGTSANSNLTSDQIKALTVTLIQNLQTDIAAITGQTTPVNVLIDIPPTADSTFMPATVAIPQIIRNPAAYGLSYVYGGGETYSLPYAASLHMYARGVTLLGEREGDIVSKIMDGTPPQLMQMSNWAINSARTQITINLNPAVGNVVIDTTTVPAAPNYGFAPVGSAPAITSVTIANNVATLNLASAAPAGAQYDYAVQAVPNPIDGTLGNTVHGVPGASGYAGTYGNIRDETAVRSRFVGSAFLRNFLLPERFTLA